MSAAAASGGTMNPDHVPFTQRVWDESILPTLTEYIRIPNVSPNFDPDWAANGHMAAAVELVTTWCRSRPIAGLTVDVHQLPGRTPLVVMEVPPFGPDAGADSPTVLLYGHLDKQPEMVGWRDDLGPWKPVIEGDRLYGRGGADDGYAAFASLTAIEAVQANGGSHARLLVLIEASEESGSPDLPAYLDELADIIGTPDLVICLDSGALDYEHLWVTTSLRGLVSVTMTVKVLTEGVHSGEASGVVPSSFRIARLLLDRAENAATGEILIPELHAEIPSDRIAEAQATAAEFPTPIATHFPLAGETRPMTDDPVEQLLARTWKPTLSVIGAEGLPPTGRAGNVLRPFTTLKLSFRLPPTCEPTQALDAVVRVLSAHPPYGATVRLDHLESGPGWNAPSFAPWLRTALDEASSGSFGVDARTYGEGGSIPFMGMLGHRFPKAQFVITGALGPGNNAHGPNEFLHLPTAERITAAMAHLLESHAASAAG